MTRARTALLLFAGLAATVCAYGQWLPPGSAECVATIERGAAAADDEAPPSLGDVCPDVAAVLNASGFAYELLGFPANELPARSFAAFAKLAPAYEAPPATVDLSASELDAVLEEVVVRVPPPPVSLVERVTKWLKEQLGRRVNVDTDWLDEWLDNLSVPERWLRYIVIALGVALVLATALIIANELRIAGVFARTRVAQRFATSAAEPDGAPRVRDLDDVRRAPLAQQPVLLLDLVLARLRGKAPIRDSSTHRELAALGAPAIPGAERPAFASVVAAAERATYGGWHPAAPELEPVLESGAAVLRSLDTEAGDAR